jgi:protein-tyrosine-phosphatase
MKILFVCKYNAFRSRVSEEYFKKVNKNKNIEIISRGLIYGGPADIEQIEMAKEMLGININKRPALQLTMEDLRTSDLIINVADDIPKIIFNLNDGIFYKKLVFWNVKDEHFKNKSNIKKIILKIQRKVDKLNKQLSKVKT